VFRDGQRVTVTCETELRNVLCAYGMDASADQTELEQNAQLMARIVGAVRNVRTTNCLLDVCYTIDGRLGGIINHSTRIWDIAAAVLMFKEAGGLLTDIKGSRIQFPIDDTALRVEYPIVGASLELHPKLIELLNS
jgi:myo-inositol-1(or 4)-monophosphatase